MKRQKTTGKRFSLFGLLVTLLSFLLVALLVTAAVRSRPRSYEYKAEPSAILYDLQKGRYVSALDSVRGNRAMGIDETVNADYAAPYEACDYFEACSYYEACRRTGDAAGASVYEAKMNAAYENMGTLQFMAQEIRKALEQTGRAGEDGAAEMGTGEK